MVDESLSDNLFSLHSSEELVSFLKKNAEGPKAPLRFIGSNIPRPYGYELPQGYQPVSLKNMNRVIDYPFKDMTITVEAGMTIAELQQRLAENNQRLPIDVPFPEETTLGGAIAANLYGSRGYHLGTWRDYVIGISAVDGQGRLFKSGGRVVKNVAGYDLAKLLIGSQGTLGAISQVTLQVRPIPEQCCYLHLTYADFNQTEQGLAKLVYSETLPVVIDVLNSKATKQIDGLTDTEHPSLLIGYEGNEKEVAWQLKQVREELKETELLSDSVVTGMEFDTALKEKVRISPDAHEGALEISVKPSKTMEVCEQLERAGVTLQCHSKMGVIRAVGEASIVEKECLPLRKLVAPAGGSVVLRRSGVTSKEQIDLFDWEPLLENSMRQVKQKLDPHHLLSPGKLF